MFNFADCIWYNPQLRIFFSTITLFSLLLYRVFSIYCDFPINLAEKFTAVSLFQNWQFYLASRRLACHIAAKIAGPTGERSACARWKNILTTYARLEIGERLCKTWLAHFKCRNAKQTPPFAVYCRLGMDRRRRRRISTHLLENSFHPISIMVLRALPKSRIFKEVPFRGNDFWHDIVTTSSRYYTAFRYTLHTFYTTYVDVIPD